LPYQTAVAGRFFWNLN